MKIVQRTQYADVKLGSTRAAIEAIKNAGFDGYDLSMLEDTNFYKDVFCAADPIAEARKLRAYADKIGLPCMQAHAPYCRLEDGEAAEKFRTEKLELAVRLAGEVGCAVIVVHPGNDLSVETNYERIYEPLLAIAREYGIKIATENMFNWSDEKSAITALTAACGTVEYFCKQVDVAGDELMTACLDIGHAEITDAPGAVALIKGLGKKRLGAIHVHDVDKRADLHVAPFASNAAVDWDEVIAALREIGYEGAFTLEADNFFLRAPAALVPASLKYLAEIARFLTNKAED